MTDTQLRQYARMYFDEFIYAGTTGDAQLDRTIESAIVDGVRDLMCA